MKYAPKRECIVSDKGDAVHILLFVLWVCAALGVFLVDAYLVLVKGGEGAGSLVVGTLFSLAAVAIGVSVYRDIAKRRRPALALRRKAMETGSHYSGRIVDAGKSRESVEYECRNDDNTTETRYFRQWNYWFEVEYQIPQEQEPRRFRAEHWNKSMERFLGCGVEVYVWYEWSQIAQMDLTLTYIDTHRLG